MKKKKRIRTADIFAEYLVGGWKAVGSTGRRTCWTTTRGRMVEHATTRLKHRQGRGRGGKKKGTKGERYSATESERIASLHDRIPLE